MESVLFSRLSATRVIKDVVKIKFGGVVSTQAFAKQCILFRNHHILPELRTKVALTVLGDYMRMK